MNNKKKNLFDDNTDINDHENENINGNVNSNIVNVNQLVSTSSQKVSRSGFITSLLKVSEKILINKLNECEDCDSTQDEMLDFLQNNNSFYHSENKKIINGKYYKKIGNDHINHFFDKNLQDYFIQFSFFPLINNYTEINIEGSSIQNLFQSTRTSTSSKQKKFQPKIKIDRIRMISLIQANNYLFMKAYEDQNIPNKKRGVSCFSCFVKKKLKPKSSIEASSSLLHNIQKNNRNNNYMNGNSGSINENLVPKTADDLGELSDNNKTNEKFAFIEVGPSSKKKKTLTPMKTIQKQAPNILPQMFSSTTIERPKDNYLNLNIDIVNNNTIGASPKNSSIISSSEPAMFPNLCLKGNVLFLLTNDILKAITYLNKTKHYESILHGFTFVLNKSAFVNDLHFYEIELRTNFRSLIKNKKIKFPIFIYGNVYFPNLVFFRGDEQVNFKILENPVITPLVIAQMMPVGFVEEDEIVDVINRKIIEENIEITKQLNYEAIIANMLPINENRHIFTIIKHYLQVIRAKKQNELKCMCFVVNTSEEQLRVYLETNELFKEIGKNQFTIKIISL